MPTLNVCSLRSRKRIVYHCCVSSKSRIWRSASGMINFPLVFVFFDFSKLSNHILYTFFCERYFVEEFWLTERILDKVRGRVNQMFNTFSWWGFVYFINKCCFSVKCRTIGKNQTHHKWHSRQAYFQLHNMRSLSFLSLQKIV